MAESENVDCIAEALALVMADIADTEALLAKVVVCYYMLTRRNKHVKSAGHIQKS